MIVNLRLLLIVIKIAGIMWKACHDETGQSHSFSTIATWAELTGRNKNRPIVTVCTRVFAFVFTQVERHKLVGMCDCITFFSSSFFYFLLFNACISSARFC